MAIEEGRNTVRVAGTSIVGTVVAGAAASLVAALLAAPTPATAQPATATQPATAAQRLGPSPEMYPRVIRLAHSGSANGRLIASVSTTLSSGVIDSAQFFESTDDGTSFHPIGTVSDPQAAGGRGSCCTTLYELPQQLGTQPAGTLLFATTVNTADMPDRSPEIRVWASHDQAHTWAYLSSCANAPGAPTGRGLWEPEFAVDARGYLDCYFSDDSQSVAGSHTGFDQVLAVATSTDGGLTWGSRRNVVAIPSTATTSYRPGMATVRRLPNGSYFMSYELCGAGLGVNACEVYYRTSTDGWNWGAGTSPGTVAQTADGEHFFHAPTIAWTPGGGPNGRILLIGEQVKDAKGHIDQAASGTTIFANTENGGGRWYQIAAPVAVTFPVAPTQPDLVCDNYSSSLLPSADGASVLELATARQADGTCAASFGTGSTVGTGDAAGVTSGETYRLRSVESGLCFDVTGGSGATGVELEQWTCNGLDPQNWKLVAKGSGYFTLTSEQSNLCAGVPGGSTSPGIQVQQVTCNGTNAQLWRLVSVGGTSYNLVSKLSGLCLDVAGGSTVAGGAVQQYTCNGLAPQIWQLEHALTVMPLGDSITDGLNGTGGYRSDLFGLFTVDGRYADFVGSQVSGPAQLRDQDHEGHPGWRIDQLDAQIAGWMATYRPDAVLLHIGTNDVIQNYSLGQAPARLSALIDHLTAADPGVDVEVATIVPFADPAQDAAARAYNAAIPGIVAAQAAAGRHVRLVDLHAAIGVADLSPDGVHPSNGGYSKMAARWYTQFTGEPAVRFEAEGAANTRNDSTIIATVNASGGKKVGNLNNADSYLDITVTVPAAGTYRMYVRAASGEATQCGHAVTINGQGGRVLMYGNFGWDQWVIVGTDVALDAGANTIRFAHDTCYAELDSIDLAG
jgi:lysophospholipase L1-like esterase